MAGLGPPESAWPADLTLRCQYDAAVVSILARTDVELGEGHRAIVSPQLLTALGEHEVTYCARVIKEFVPPTPGKKRKDPDAKGKWVERWPCGRYIAQGPSPQTLPCWVRRLACYRTNWELDQVNSRATIMWWMAVELKIEQRAPRLRSYVQRRDAILEKMQHEHGIDYATAKQRITAILGGSKPDDAVNWEEDLMHEAEMIMTDVLGAERFEAECNKYYTQDLTEWQLFARVIFAKERQIMEVVMAKLRELGYEPGALIHDSVLIRRPSPLAPLDFAHGIEGIPLEEEFGQVAAIEEAISRECGLFMRMKVKSLRPLEEDVTRLLNLPRDCFTAHEAALEAYFHCAPYIRHCAEGIALYDPTNNVWELSDKKLNNVAMPRLFAPFAHRLTARAPKNKKALHFLHNRNAAKDMLMSLMGVIPCNELWKDRALRKGRGYLCFRNGYWDFNQVRVR